MPVFPSGTAGKLILPLDGNNSLPEALYELAPIRGGHRSMVVEKQAFN